MSAETHNVMVRGIGWLDGQTWGTVRRPQRVSYGGEAGVPPWKRAELFAGGVKNFGRFDQATRMTLCACALALNDAGQAAPSGTVGLVGTNVAGSLEANRAYFSDYLQAGRVLARGNLFIYTLPSSPLAETAIHFGLRGPLMYVGVPGGHVGEALQAGVDLMDDGAATGMLVVQANETAGIAFLLDREGSASGSNGGRRDLGVKRCREALAGVDQGIAAWVSLLECAVEGSDGV
jgi:3-oxoacyl-[acyl-carrier-protein] synthase II